MKNQRGISTLAGIITIIVVAIVLFGSVFAYSYFSTKPQQNSEFFASRQKTTQTPTQSQTQTPGSPAKASATEGWKIFTDSSMGFEFKYPGDMFAGESGGGGAFILSVDVYNLNSEGKLKDIAVSMDLYSKETVDLFGWKDRNSGADQKVIRNIRGDMILISIGLNKSEENRSVFNGVVNTFKFIKL